MKIVSATFFSTNQKGGRGGAMAQLVDWLRHCATSRKIAGSIPDVVTGIFL